MVFDGLLIRCKVINSSEVVTKIAGEPRSGRESNLELDY